MKKNQMTIVSVLRCQDEDAIARAVTAKVAKILNQEYRNQVKSA